jgi:hypothetical protein
MSVNNVFLWLELVSNLSAVVANQSGEAPKELGYLDILITGMREKTLTDEGLLELRAKYQEEKLLGREPTNEDLAALRERLLARSERIQMAASDVGSLDEVLGERK